MCMHEYVYDGQAKMATNIYGSMKISTEGFASLHHEAMLRQFCFIPQTQILSCKHDKASKLRFDAAGGNGMLACELKADMCLTTLPSLITRVRSHAPKVLNKYKYCKVDMASRSPAKSNTKQAQCRICTLCSDPTLPQRFHMRQNG